MTMPEDGADIPPMILSKVVLPVPECPPQTHCFAFFNLETDFIEDLDLCAAIHKIFRHIAQFDHFLMASSGSTVPIFQTGITVPTKIGWIPKITINTTVLMSM